MKNFYIFRYIWNDLWHSANRPFTLINTIAITVSVTILVLLLGGLLAFRQSSDARIGEMGLRIEVTAHEETEVTEKQKNGLLLIPQIGNVYWWKPTLFLFYNAQGHLYDGIGGRTVELDDPLLRNLEDIRNKKPIRFFTKKEIPQSNFDEIGIVVPFIMLKQLSYLPSSAKLDQPKTWEHIPLPSHLKIRVKGAAIKAIDINLPVVGVVAEKTAGRYLVTRDCYKLLGVNWQDGLEPFIIDRDGKPLIENSVPKKEIPDLETSPDTHASIYVEKRDDLLPTIHKIRGLELRALSALEHYIEDYEQQETFFIVAAGGICFALFLFTGVILFATFYALTLRKVKEIGILKACGASSWLVNKIFVFEAVTIGFMAISFGAGIGILSGYQLGAYMQGQLGITQSSLYIMPLPYTISIFLFGLTFCFLVTFIPVRMAVNVDPDSVIRSN